MRVIAHRGASAHAPENTLAALRRALELGAQAVEFDVHQTADGELVVVHDPDLRRVAGRRARVRDMTLAELAFIDVGSWFGPRFKGERIPRLDEVLGLPVELHIEIKAGSRVYPGIEGRVVEAIRAAGATARAVISSFDHRALFAVRAVAPEARIGYLLGLTSMRKGLREASELRAESLNLGRRQVNGRHVARAHERGLQVLVYTVDKARELARLRRIGVDGVFTNRPELSSAGENR